MLTNFFKDKTDYEFNVVNTLKQLGLVWYYKKDDNYWLTEKGIEAKRLGGYFKYKKRKEKFILKDIIVVFMSALAIVVSALPFIFETTKVTNLKKDVEKLNLKFDSISSSVKTLSLSLKDVSLDTIPQCKQNDKLK